MAFIIETQKDYPVVQVKLLHPVRENDKVAVSLALNDIFSRRKQNSSVFLTVNFEKLSTDYQIPLVQIISTLADVYHKWRGKLSLEVLIVIQAELIAPVRYLAENFALPMHVFLTKEAAKTYVQRYFDDTQPIRPEHFAKLAQTLALNDSDTEASE